MSVYGNKNTTVWLCGTEEYTIRFTQTTLVDGIYSLLVLLLSAVFVDNQKNMNSADTLHMSLVLRSLRSHIPVRSLHFLISYRSMWLPFLLESGAAETEVVESYCGFLDVGTLVLFEEERLEILSK